MHQKNSLKTFMLCLFVWAVAGCDTEDPIQPDPDYRSEWLGTYIGWTVQTWWIMGQPTTTTEGPDTIVVVADGDSAIALNGGPAVPIDSFGSYSAFSGPSSYFSLQFVAPDSLYVTNHGGGLGGGTTYNFKGKK